MGAIDTVKGTLSDLLAIAKTLGNLELNQKLIELQQSVLDLQQQIQQLRQENEQLNANQNTDAELTLEDNALWHRNAATTRQGPFCKVCWPDQQKLIPLNIRGDTHQTCPKCKGEFPTEASREATQRRIQERRAQGEAKRRQLRRRRADENLPDFTQC